MDNSKYLIQRFDDMQGEAREKVINHVFGVARDTAFELKKQVELELLSDRYEEIQERYKNWNKHTGLYTGNWVIDRMTMGLAPGEVTVVGGATSNGKTALSINIAAHVAMQGITVLFVTLEMTPGELGVRFKKVMGDKFEDFMSNIVIQKNDELDWKSVDGLMRKAREDAGVGLVVIDHLHYFTRELKNVAEDLGNITKEFKKNAIRHNVPVILISHTRKAPDSFTTKTGINDLRGSSYIAQDADIVLMVHRDKDFPDDIIVSLEKNRNRYGCRIGSYYNFKFEETKVIEPVYNADFGKGSS